MKKQDTKDSEEERLIAALSKAWAASQRAQHNVIDVLHKLAQPKLEANFFAVADALKTAKVTLREWEDDADSPIPVFTIETDLFALRLVRDQFLCLDSDEPYEMTSTLSVLLKQYLMEFIRAIPKKYDNYVSENELRKLWPN